ncbi:MAG: nitroreductase/quinone reductase family protein [Propionibacteriaceae bacterium]|nr:nitroreductase/quinone reductase family protein [Propionibacteriaceae bacterium]
MTAPSATDSHRATDAPAEMALIHRIARHAFRDVARWVDQIPPEGTKRSRAVGSFLTSMLDMLHDHHENEDALIWPKLRERVDPSLIDPMERAHEDVAAAAARVRQLVPAWARDPSRAAQVALLAALAEFRALLTAHLDEEEREVVPLIAQHLTQAEWAAVGEAGFKKIPKSFLFTATGLLLDAATPVEAAHRLGELPRPAQILWRTVGQHAYARTRNQLRGAPMPPPLRFVMRHGVRRTVAGYRRTNGRTGASAKGLPVLLLTVVGRRSGLDRTVAVAYFDRGPDRLVIGSMGGAQHEPEWFRNLRATDTATIQIGATVQQVGVRIPEREERDQLWSDIITEAPFFIGYQRRAQRLIPIAVLTTS